MWLEFGLLFPQFGKASGLSLEPCPAASLLAPLVLGMDDPNRSPGRIGRRHELVDRLDELLKLSAGVAAQGVVCERRERGRQKGSP